jgi:ABC-type dipeptide/oligopeptide/nickel transport system permease subunit
MSMQAAVAVPAAPPSRWARPWRRLRGNPLSVAVVAALAVVVAIALVADLIAPYAYLAVVGPPFQRPSARHWLGTDEIGRDVLSRLVVGTRITLAAGLVATAIAMIIGVPMGLVSGYYGRGLDAAMMRITDGLLAFPPIILAMAMVAVLGASLTNTMIAIGIVQVPRFSRLVRALTVAARQREFVEAARALGAADVHIMRRAILPNVASLVTVQFSLAFATAVLTEAGLSFLGLGVQPPSPSWGLMLDLGRKVLSQNPFYALSAGGAVFLIVLLFTLLGDTLRDILDPAHGTRRGPAPALAASAAGQG